MFILELKTILMLYGADAALSNKELYPTTLNLNPSPDSSYIRAMHALAVEYHWNRISYVCPSREHGEFVGPFPIPLCGQINRVMHSLVPRPYSLNLFELPHGNSLRLEDYDYILDNIAHIKSRG